MNIRSRVCTAVLQFLVMGAAVLVAWPAPAQERDKAAGGARLLGKLEGASGAVVAFSADGAKLLTAGERQVRVWDARTFRPYTPPLQHDGRVARAVLSGDGHTVVAVAGGSEVAVCDVLSGKQRPGFRHGAEVLAAAFSADGSRAVTGGRDNLAIVWDVVGAKQVVSLKHPHPVRWVAFSPDATQVLAVSAADEIDRRDDETRGMARLWDVQSGQLVQKQLVDPIVERSLHRRSWRTPVSFSPDGGRFAVIDFRIINICDVKSDGGTFMDAYDDAGTTTATAFSPDGTKILTAGAGGAMLWQLPPIKTLIRPEDEPQPKPKVLWHVLRNVHVRDAAFSPDGRRVLLSAFDGKSGVWEVQNGNPVLSFAEIDQRHSYDAPVIAYAPDGRRVAVGLPKDDVTLVWELGERSR